MATSGSVNFTTNRDEVIKYALLNVGGIASGVTPTATQITDSAFLLNGIVKHRQTDGMPLWALKRGYIFPIHDTSEILLGPTGGYAAHVYHDTIITADSASAATTITVESVGIMATNDKISVELDDGKIHQTTIVSVVGNVVTLTDGLPSATSENNKVYAYDPEDQIHRPLRIIHATTHNFQGNNDQPLRMLSSTEFFNLGTKQTKSYPLQFAYSPQLVNGIFLFWPQWINGKSLITIYFHRPFEDFDSANDEPDFPQEWIMPLVWELSWALSASYGVPLKERQIFLMESQKLRDEALGFAQEEGSIYFEPDLHFRVGGYY